ncbi:hypothetical protein THAOC_17306 [Thalassiosira oceanica]|uniref:ENTH domain-containing protein n=1 Tax=Thalassiosira oceanica TaxID=159749 RepID=K0SA10_THAOC|nr:hypothetical protein THAOC_17306 [Thalassiosira oceanica]|eukprot:EJK62095.1 hypothetical protein THAOC_17306 [Thalassiosira oceanica]
MREFREGKRTHGAWTRGLSVAARLVCLASEVGQGTRAEWAASPPPRHGLGDEVAPTPSRRRHTRAGFPFGSSVSHEKLSSPTYRFNQVKPKNEVEARVYEVLSHKNWGASSTLMNEIAQFTFDYERCELHIGVTGQSAWERSPPAP